MQLWAAVFIQWYQTEEYFVLEVYGPLFCVLKGTKGLLALLVNLGRGSVNPKPRSCVARFIVAFIRLKSFGPQRAKNKNAPLWGLNIERLIYVSCTY